MSVQTASALPAIGILAASLSLSILAPQSAGAADSCLTAPKGPAPEGSHWYYRIERPSLRKCWRLVQQGQGEKTAVARKAPQPELDEATEAPAPVASVPATRTPVPETKPAIAPVIQNLMTRNVSNTDEAVQPLLAPAPSVSAAPRAENPSAPAATEQVSDQPAPAAIVDQPVLSAHRRANVADDEGRPTLRLLLGAIAFFGLLACAVFIVLETMRRRNDILNIVPSSAPIGALPETLPAADAPTFAPLPPMAAMPRQDDVEDALRRFRQRHAA